MDTERLTEPSGNSSQMDIKLGASSMAGSDDSLDKSDMEEPEHQYKSYQSSMGVLDRKMEGNSTTFLRHEAARSSDSPPRNSPTGSYVEVSSENSAESSKAAADAKSSRSSDTITEHPLRPAPPTQRKRNPYSIEELLKKDEKRSLSKTPRLSNVMGVVQPCGIIVSKEM